ncbi:MAG: hypothetical protein II790_06875 [Schwartzia sp.]|nr:hypothetical protein [Schwartzia sp. (in: firmicutes)]
MNEKLKTWARIIAEAEASGMGIRKWCEKNGVKDGTYYYWHKLVRVNGMLPCRAAGSAASKEEEGGGLAEIDLTAPAPFGSFMSFPFETQLMIQKGSCQVFIGNGFSSQVLSRVLEVIS